MYRQRNRFLVALLCIIFICSSVQATVLLISVRDSTDNSTIPNATIFLNGTSYGITDANGQFSFTHPGLDDQLIRVAMAGYNDWENLVPKNETSIQVNLSRQRIILKIDLYDSDSMGIVPGARVDISAENHTQTKLTDATGSVIFEVNATTTYSIDIAAPDYLSREGIIDVGTEDMDAQYWLLPSNRFSFIIKDKDDLNPIPDAEVRLDTILAGETDTRGVLTIPVSRGNEHTIEVNRSGYYTYTETKVIRETDAIDSIVLTKALVGASINTVDENLIPINDTELYVNGTFVGTTNQFGRINFSSLVSGSYIIEARKTGYVPLNRTIVIANPGEEFTFEMPFETAALTIFVEEKDHKTLPNATIIINGNTVGTTDARGQYNTEVRFNTFYNISAVKDMYQTVSIETQFMQGNTTPPVTLTMEKNPDWGLITLIVAGAIAIFVLFGIIRMLGGRKRRLVMRKNEL